MSKSIVIKDANVVNEGQVTASDLKIKGDKISRIDRDISVTAYDQVVDANGCFLLPGMIDDQVHFGCSFLPRWLCCNSVRRFVCTVICGS
jgi:dihydroorotase-like cyclic amidohydrolase